ncbi:hypothetical protein [Agromyces seonyuensis]|uniref:Uncharacterized protein n=1 Tax=Agromyces seonyuensis TaxID=2662446 RepID=A0A6I4NX61_9MICO|nr:hypothetical protein [Agromyces seonyuensis]MWB98828.1 hypothetical protein [Agromyces seonyuensis]
MNDTGPVRFSGSLERPVTREHALREALPGRSGRQLVFGVLLIALLVAAGWFIHFLALRDNIPATRHAWWPWIALAIAVVLSIGLIVAANGQPSRPMLALVCLFACGVSALELVTTAGLLDAGVTLTATGAVGMLLAVVAVLGDPRFAGSTGVLIGAFALSQVLVQAPQAGVATIEGVGMALAASLPAVLTAVAVTGFNRMVGVDLDHSIVQSTVGVGPTQPIAGAGDELASLDLEAEQLLAGVAAGRIPLPLPPAESALAARVGASLRIRLIEGRTDTWLKHAIAESELLAGAAVVDDPEGDAARLAPAARDALLLSLWLLVDDRPRGSQVPIRVIVDNADAETDRLVSIDLVIAGGSRRRIDPTTWETLGNVGSYRTFFEERDFRITILSRVEPDAPERTARSQRKAER